MASVPAPHATLKSASRLRLFFEWLPFRFPFSLAWLASCPNRCPFFFLFQVVVTRGGMRRPASPCEQTAVQIRHLANCDEGERLANCDEGERRSNLEPRAPSPANLRIDSLPPRPAFKTVPGHPEADEAGFCVDIACLGKTGVDGRFRLRRERRTPVQPCAPSPANLRTHSPPSRSTLQSIPGHQEPFQWRTAPMLPGPRGLCFFVAFHCAGRPMAPPH